MTAHIFLKVDRLNHLCQGQLQKKSRRGLWINNQGTAWIMILIWREWLGKYRPERQMFSSSTMNTRCYVRVKKHDFGICIFSEIPEMSCLSCVFIFLSLHRSAWLQCLTGWNYFYPWRKFHQSLKALQEFQCNTWYNLFQEYQQAILTEIWPKKVAFWLKTISRLLQRNRNNKCCWLWPSVFSSPFFLSSSTCC